MTSGQPTAGVVIVTYNSAAVIVHCLESLEAHEGDAVDVTIVDNASTDGTPELIADRFPWVRLHREAENRGFAAGVNAGVRLSPADFVLLLNPDTYLTQPLLVPLAAFMEADATIGALGPRVLNEDGSVQFSCRRYPTMWSSLFNRTSLLTRLFPNNRFSRDYLMSDFDHASVRDVDWLAAPALMLRRSAFEQVGGMDEGYFMYFEDVDLCHRLHSAGYRVVYYPHVEIVHLINRSSGPISSRRIFAQTRGSWRYWRTYRSSNPIVDAAAAAAIGLRGLGQLAGNAARRLVG